MLWFVQDQTFPKQFIGMPNPGRVHWDAVKRVFRYLRGTSDYSLCYHSNMNKDDISLDIHGYVDSYWVGDFDCR